MSAEVPHGGRGALDRVNDIIGNSASSLQGPAEIHMTRFVLAVLFASLAFAESSELDLSGDWRRSTGDRPEYARPDFDDRHWQTVKLPWEQNPPAGLYWLRRSVELPPALQGRQIFLTLGPIAEAYEIYFNGERVATFGQFGTLDRIFELARSRTFPISPDSARLLIAIRVERRAGAQAFVQYDGGLYRITPGAPDLAETNQILLLRKRLKYSPGLVINSNLLSFAFLFWLLWLTERNRIELAWLGLLAASRGVGQFVIYLAISHETRRLPPAFEVSHALSGIALAELILCFSGFRSRWIRIFFWSAWALYSALSLPVHFTAIIDSFALAVVIFGWWRDRKPGWPTWLALILVTLSHFNVGLRALPTSIEAWGYDFNLTSASIAILSVLLAFLSLRRLAADRREKQRLATELEAARTVQQLLLPASETSAGGYEANAVYASALEVGGDFHWNRVEPGGSLVVVAGDVSGKGLKAAMLVSVAVGALRAERSNEPTALLATLNSALAGHTGGGFVTACCVRFEPGGAVTVANAGHPPPWLDGQEVATEPGLPLGIDAETVYEGTCLRMARGALMTLVSDGVVEAANPQGELFGFDRTQAISGATAQQIAEAAKAWGQNDDITVVTVRRSA